MRLYYGKCTCRTRIFLCLRSSAALNIYHLGHTALAVSTAAPLTNCSNLMFARSSQLNEIFGLGSMALQGKELKQFVSDGGWTSNLINNCYCKLLVIHSYSANAILSELLHPVF